MRRRPPRSTQSRSSAASDVYKRQGTLSRICVFGDVHGNLPAFEAVLAQADECDALWCVGDTVGYGPFPDESTKKVEELGAVGVAGNHDLGSLGKISLFDFNVHARVACEWTCLLYTSDAADDLLCVDLGGRRIIKKKKKK